jgi:hypothetical protein
MAIAFDAMVLVAPNGQVSWSFSTGSAAETCGFASTHRSGTVGHGGPDDGSGLREADLLTALESLASAMSRASRAFATSYPLLPISNLQLPVRSDDIDA